MANRNSALRRAHDRESPPAAGRPAPDAGDAGNIISLVNWNVPLPALAECDGLGCACDIAAAGGNGTHSAVTAALDYHKEMLALGFDILDSLRTTLDAAETAEDAGRQGADAILTAAERYWTGNFRLAERLYRAGLVAMDGLVTLPRHFAERR